MKWFGDDSLPGVMDIPVSPIGDALRKYIDNPDTGIPREIIPFDPDRKYSADEVQRFFKDVAGHFGILYKNTAEEYTKRYEDLRKYTSDVEATSKLMGRQNLVLSYFYQASQMLSSSLDSDTVVSMIVNMLGNIFEDCTCYLYTVGEDGLLHIKYSQTDFARYFNENVKMPIGKGCEGMCISEEFSTQVSDVYTDPIYNDFVHLAEAFKFKSILSVPLIVREKVEGCISLYGPEQGFFPEEDIRILTIFSNQAAQTIENAYLYEQTDEKLQKRVKILSLIHQMDQAIIENNDVESISNVLLEGIKKTLPNAVFALELPKLEQPLWVQGRDFEATGFDRETLNKTFGEDLKRDLISRRVVKKDGIEFYLKVFPISLQKEVIGFLFLISEEAHLMDEEPEEFVKGIIFQLSIAIEKQRTLKRLLQSEKMSVLGSLMSGIAHEINNPLCRILGISESFRDETDVNKVEKYFDLIIEDSLRCKRIIENFLLFARKDKAKKSVVDVNSVIIKALQLWNYQKKTTDMEIRTELASRMPKVKVNVNQIEQVLLNITVNAYHALSKLKGSKKLLMVKTSNSDGKVRIIFQDNGPGIPKDKIKEIFQPFYTDKPAGQGTGLGLSISSNIISEHGGRIWAENPQQGGARFVIELMPQEAAPEKMEVSSKDEAREVKKGRVLVVDDDLLILKLISTFLKKKGHHVDAVRDGYKFLDKAFATDYDVVISDMTMPEIKGDELILEIEKKKPDILKRMILCTGDILEKEKAEEIEALGVRMLYKPFEMAELKKIVETVIEG